MMHTAMEMTHTSKAGVCNDTMADQWMECGPCVLDPCVMVLTHNCTYGSQGEVRTWALTVVEVVNGVFVMNF